MKTTSPPLSDEQAITALEAIYQQLEERLLELNRFHEDRSNCNLGCRQCCVDDISVFEVESLQIKTRYQSLLHRDQPHPTGACAFLSASGACRIYPHRPYVCRTQGLPLRWFDQLDNGETVELRDICPLNDSPPPIEKLPAEWCWTIGPIESQLAALQRSRLIHSMRVLLRSLFSDSRADSRPDPLSQDTPPTTGNPENK